MVEMGSELRINKEISRYRICGSIHGIKKNILLMPSSEAKDFRVIISDKKIVNKDTHYHCVEVNQYTFIKMKNAVKAIAKQAGVPENNLHFYNCDMCKFNPAHGTKIDWAFLDFNGILNLNIVRWMRKMSFKHTTHNADFTIVLSKASRGIKTFLKASHTFFQVNKQEHLAIKKEYGFNLSEQQIDYLHMFAKIFSGAPIAISSDEYQDTVPMCMFRIRKGAGKQWKIWDYPWEKFMFDFDRIGYSNMEFKKN